MFFRKRKPPVVATAPAPVAVTTPEIIEIAETTGPRKKILVVDDDPIILKTLSFTLKSNGYQVITAIDGSQAIGIMRDEKPDMMVVDVCIPPDVASGGVVPWDGFQIADWIRRFNGRVPTIVISGAAGPDYKQRAAAVGAEAFFSKPLDNGLLLASINSALSRNSGAAKTATAS